MRVSRGIITVTLLIAGLSFGGPVQAQQGQRPSTLQEEERTLRPGDVLRISVWPDEDLGGEFVVEESGYAYLPMLGRVQVEGVPLDDLRADLRAGYAETVKNPVVTITPVFNVGVLGEVRSPGVYSATPTTTLLDAIGQAGGFTGEADQEQVRLVREGQAIQYNAERALERGLDVSALRLRSGDQVVVPVVSRGITFGNVLTFIQTGATIAFLIDRATN